MRSGRWILVVLLVAAGAFAAGYAVARRSSGPPGRPLKTGAAPATDALGAAVQAALLDPDRVAGIEKLAGLLHRSGPESLPQVRDAFEAVFLDVAEIEVVLLAEWWAAFDPSGAYAWSRNSVIARHPLVLRAVIEAWARRDPQAANAALRAVREPGTLRMCLDSLVSGWDASGQPGLMDYLRSMPVGVEPLMAMAPLARRHVLRDGPERTFAWAESLPDDPPEDALRFKLQMFRRVATAAADVDPAKASVWVARHAQGPNGDGLLARVGTVWAPRPGQGEIAMRWLSTLAAGKQRDDGVQETFQAWNAYHPGEASAWLAAQQDAAWLEPAFLQYAVYISRDHPDEAMSWVRRIQNADLRNRGFVAVGNTWLQNDEKAARAWLASDEPTPEVRDQILLLEQRRIQAEQRRASRLEAKEKQREADGLP
jgi:hypothetical protein